ncbi:MAG: serine hydrolase domain-containing protein [Ferruginibacter sp.]|nr:beta-lactamase family protein [Chitinophagaceae bacterium]
MKHFYFIIVLLSVCKIGKAQSWQDTVLSIDKLFARYKPANPGAQLAISRNGKIIFSKAWGMADLEHNAPLTTESISEAGSVSKQFTAAAILLLEQQGKLTLDDDVKKYVPELPDYGYTITLRQMIQHKSGLRDWGYIADIAGWPRTTRTYNNDDALYIICNQKTLNYKPGDEYLYSNSNYQLLTIIVQRVSGLSLAEYTRKYIFEPAGMKHTQWRDNYKRVVPNRAMAYSRYRNAYETEMPNEFVYGNGGLLTTAEDLLIWSDYFMKGKFGTPSLLEQQSSTSTLNNGVMHRYSAGLFNGKHRGWKYFSHDGATAGYRANFEAYPELGLSFVWLSNTSEFDSDTINVAESVSDIFIPVKESEPEMKALPPYDVSKEKLNSYTGWYRNTKTGGGLKLYMQQEKLYGTEGGQLKPVAENVFLTRRNNRVEISPKGLLIIRPEKDSVYFSKVDAAKLNEKTMQEYVGEYYSDEVEVKYHVQVKNGKLFLLLKPRLEYQLTPTYENGFDIPDGVVYFEREKKKVINFKISVERARNVEFRKIK